MNKNIKIAKELVRIAKNLVAEQNVANKPGKYENFTGAIEWDGTHAQVETATFELKNNGKIIWYDGTWIKGTWSGGTWKNGTWCDGSWVDGIWENGIWEMGTWFTTFTARWENGKWCGGYGFYGNAENDIYHRHGDSPDKWNK